MYYSSFNAQSAMTEMSGQIQGRRYNLSVNAQSTMTDMSGQIQGRNDWELSVQCVSRFSHNDKGRIVKTQGP